MVTNAAISAMERILEFHSRVRTQETNVLVGRPEDRPKLEKSCVRTQAFGLKL